MGSPPALGAEGHGIAVGAIAVAIYANHAAAGNPGEPHNPLPRAAIESTVEALVGLLDHADDDADCEDDDPAEHDGTGNDAAWIEWGTMLPAHRKGPNRLAGHEDDELDDAPEDDDPGGCEHDGREPENDE